MSTNRFPDAERVLVGHISADTAFVVSDYPYGFELRCQKRYWVETKKGYGQRLVTQTSNPKKPGTWNKPKPGTYSPLVVLYVEPQTGHVQATAWTGYDGKDALCDFATKYQLDDAQKRIVDQFLKAYARVELHRRITGDREVA